LQYNAFFSGPESSPPFDSSEGATEALHEIEADWTDDWLSSQSIVECLFVLGFSISAGVIIPLLESPRSGHITRRCIAA